ncbi:MAG: FIST C-terminal domain-containing protein [Synergistaceae bacterium]|nr:FIST C-terminal domain-containing protein [Synergistaceae bacterium]
MRSIVAVSEALDDADDAVEELMQQVEAAGPLCKNGLGLLFCDVELDHEEFMTKLKDRLPFDIAGFTGVAQLDGGAGARIMAVTLAVLHGDDVGFGTSVTDVLTEDNLRGELEASYARALAKAPKEEPKLVMLFTTAKGDMPVDDYLDTISAACGDVPVFGGVPSSSMADREAVIYADGHAYTDRAVVSVITGNVRPVCSVRNVLTDLSPTAGIVTGSRGCVIRSVGDKSFVDFLRSIGMDVDGFMAQKDLSSYVSTPLKVNLSKGSYSDGIPTARTIKDLYTDGSGSLFGAVPEKSKVTLVTLKRQDIRESSGAAIRDVTAKMAKEEEDGYKYSILLCISCAGRFMVMADDSDLEGKTLLENMPEGVNMAGVYAFGEICPTMVTDGRALNRFHNESITMCAL